MASLCPANLRHRPLLLQSTSRSSAVARIAARPLGAAPFPRRPVKVTQAQPNYGQPSYGQPYGQQDPKYPNIYQSPYEATPPAQEPPEYAQRAGSLLSEEEERDRLAVGTALRNIGWLSFWSQLTLTIISGVILLFSIGITNQGVVNLNFINIATLVGVVGSFISTFLAWSFVQAGRRLGMLQEVKLSKVEGTVLRGTTLNLLGMGATLVGLQATVGGLVAKTLSSAAAGPAVYAGRAGSAPPVALDVFSVQACTNTVLAHFLAIAFSNWLLRVLNKYIQKETQQQGPSQPPTPTLV